MSAQLATVNSEDSDVSIIWFFKTTVRHNPTFVVGSLLDRIKLAAAVNPGLAMYLKTFDEITEPSAALQTSFSIPEIKEKLIRVNTVVDSNFVEIASEPTIDLINEKVSFD